MLSFKYTVTHFLSRSGQHTYSPGRTKTSHTHRLTLNTNRFSAAGYPWAGTQREASTSWSRVVSSRTQQSESLTSCCKGRAWADRWLESSWGTASCNSTEMSLSKSSLFIHGNTNMLHIHIYIYICVCLCCDFQLHLISSWSVAGVLSVLMEMTLGFTTFINNLIPLSKKTFFFLF